jgi:hypothetical protein
MLAGSLTAELGWGLLVVSDSRADYRQLPGSTRNATGREPVLASGDAVGISVLHGQDGPVTTRVWVGADEPNRRGKCDLGGCVLRLDSGSLVIGDVVNEETSVISMEPGAYSLRIGADSTVQPTEIDLVFLALPA